VARVSGSNSSARGQSPEGARTRRVRSGVRCVSGGEEEDDDDAGDGVASDDADDVSDDADFAGEPAAAVPRRGKARGKVRRQKRAGNVTVTSPCPTPGKRRKTGATQHRAGVEEDSDGGDFPGTPMLKNAWTRRQLEAFDAQRTAVPAGLPDYWARVAAGVDGKSTADCAELWESDWASPAAAATVSDSVFRSDAAGNGARAKAKAGEVSTPEIAAKMVSVAPAAKRTAKYKANLRRVAAALNRDCDDDALEPPLLASSSPGGSRADPLPDTVIASQALLRGTPDTAAKSKRAAAERLGTAQTPEILSRGRSFGLPEADSYMAVFNKRRAALAAAGDTGAEVRRKKHAALLAADRADPALPGLRPALDDLFGPESQALADGDGDGASSDDDPFF
jgi:hypothetical protein